MCILRSTECARGLNVIEQWKGANDFVFFGKHGELASNEREDNELNMLALHLLQLLSACVSSLHGIANALSEER